MFSLGRWQLTKRDYFYLKHQDTYRLCNVKYVIDVNSLESA